MEPTIYFVTCFDTFSAAAAHARAAAGALGHTAYVERTDDKWWACVPSESSKADDMPRPPEGQLRFDSRQEAQVKYDLFGTFVQYVELWRANSGWYLQFPDRESLEYCVSGKAEKDFIAEIKESQETDEEYEAGSLVSNETLRADLAEYEEEQAMERELDELREEVGSWFRTYREIEADNGC